MSEERLRDIVEQALCSADDARGDGWARSVALDLDPAFKAITAQLQAAEPDSQDLRSTLGYIIARKDRDGPAISLKPANVTREVSRTLQVVALFGLLEGTAAQPRPDPLRILSAVIGFGFAAYAATRATVGYSDAAVLHKAWRLVGHRTLPVISIDELIERRGEIVSEYAAPKCASDTEIRDAVRNLSGLKALVLQDGVCLLKEKIIFFADGRIMN